MKKSVIYLDNNATTAVAAEVLEAMLPFLRDQYANPSSPHSFGGAILRALDQARERTAALLAVHPSEILFTSGGTEANHLAIHGVLSALPAEKRHVIVSSVEHSAILRPCEMLEKQGYIITRLPVDGDGQMNPEALKQAIRPETALASIMAANNETGVIFPINELAAIAQSRGVVFHTDAVQAVGKIPIDLKEIPVGLLSLSGHKLHAPKGIGVLYIKKGTPWKPVILGGHQERDRRGGTENVPGIVGVGKACEELISQKQGEIERIRQLRDKLERELENRVSKMVIHGKWGDRLPNTSLISFQNVDSETLILALSDRGVCVSSGSACVSGLMLPSHVLKAMAVPEPLARGTIRFSLSRYTTADEIDQTTEAVAGLVEQIRYISGDIDWTLCRNN